MARRNQKNVDYWRKREEAAKKKYLKEEAAYQKEVEKIYKDMLDECQKEIEAFYARYAKKEGITIAEAKRRVSAADIDEYARKAQKYVKERNFSDKANTEMALYNLKMKLNRLELLKAKIGIELVSGFDQIDKITAAALLGRTLDELKRQAGILGDTIGDQTGRADTIVNASFHGATFSEDIWRYQSQLKTELDNLLRKGLIQGKHPNALANEIKKKFGSSRYQAERLMRTELARVQTQAAQESFVRNGYEQYIFLPHNDACNVCLSIKDKVYNVADMQIGINAPPMHPNCRCSIAAYAKDEETYEKWLYGDEMGPRAEVRNRVKGVVKNFAKDPLFEEKGKPFMPHFTPEEVFDDLEKSSIGAETLKYLKESGTIIEFVHGIQMHTNRGEEQDGKIKVFVYNNARSRVAAQTIIHEVTHKKYNIGGSQWAEVVCYIKEKEHSVNRKLTLAEKKDIIKKIKEAYSDLPWRTK